MLKQLKLEEGWSTALFLLGAILAAGWVLVAADWTGGLDIVPTAGVGGMVAGLLLGWSVFRPSTCHLFGTVYGLAWVGLLLGSQLPPQLTWRERIIQLAARLFHWVGQAVTGGKGYDTLVFVMLLGALFWILGYSAAWHTYRRMRAWRAIMPLGIVAFINVYYYYGTRPLTGYLALFAFFALLYVVRCHFFEQEGTWQRERVAYDPVIRFDFLRAGLALALVTLALAWVAPGATSVPQLAETWHRLSEPWRDVQEQFQRLFSTLRGGPTTPGIVEPFGSSLALGGPREVEDNLLMDIEAPHEGRYYWRGAIYTHYDGTHWEAMEKEHILLLPGQQPEGLSNDALRRRVVQTITNYVPGRRTLVGASQPVSADREVKAYINLTEEAPIEFTRMLSLSPLEPDAQYRVISQVSEADVQALRQAGTDYPDWIHRRYLQLPSTLPDRVRQLAEEITANAENPYDKAIALEWYLRQTITYDLAPPARPEGREYVDFLLFDSQRDYCNGYATSMVVLARSLGIPARLVAGYAQGEYDAERSVYQVRETNAHSWPEIYFPDYGWIEFEPTVSELPIVRPEGAVGEEEDDRPRGGPWERSLDEELGAEMGRNLPELDDTLEQDAQTSAARTTRILWPMAGVLALAAIGAGGWWAAENWGYTNLPAVELAYARLLRLGRWVGRPLRPSDTPLEWGRDLSDTVPQAREPIGQIVNLYVHARFARGTQAVPEAETAWKQARPALWLGCLRRIVPLHKLRSWPQRLLAWAQSQPWLRRFLPLLGLPTP